jgi:hypothetical protein
MERFCLIVTYPLSSSPIGEEKIFFMDLKIDITNPEAITYITNEIGYTI